MKNLNKVNSLLLLVVSSLIMAGCGGDSNTSKSAGNENSSDDVAVQLEVQSSQEDNEVTTALTNNTVSEYRKGEWIPTVKTNSSKQIVSKTLNTISNISSEVISRKVESTGENTEGWEVYDIKPIGATITSVYDETKLKKVIELKGDNLNNGYALGWSFTKKTSWNDTLNNTIKWSMKFNEKYTIYVRLSTPNGYRYLYYTATNSNNGVSKYDSPHYIHNGLGTNSNDGTWKTFTRNLSADLKRFDKFNTITSVDGFFVRGSGRIADVELLKTASKKVNEVIYEDAEDGLDSKWSVYDTSPSGAVISNVLDSEKSSRVIELSGSGLDNGFILGAWNSKNGWKNTSNKEISWDMKYNENYIVYISVITSKGHRFMTYSPTGNNVDSGLITYKGYTYIHLGLNTDTKSNSWKTVTRNLEADLKKYEPNNSLISATAFLIRGPGKLDDIKMFDTEEAPVVDNSTN